MQRAGLISPYFELPVRESGQHGWVGASELFFTNDRNLHDMVSSCGWNSWGTNNSHVAGSAFMIAYLNRLVWPVIGQYVLERRVPHVSLDNLAFHRVAGGIDATGLNQPSFALLPDDPCASHPDAEVASDLLSLYEKLKEWMFDANLSMVIPALNRAAKASIKVSHNAVAYACAQAFHRLYPVVKDPDLLVREANRFFDDHSSMVYQQLTMEVFEHQRKLAFLARRRGCCLVWRTERANGYCSNCILVPREEQDRLFRQSSDGWRDQVEVSSSQQRDPDQSPYNQGHRRMPYGV